MIRLGRVLGVAIWLTAALVLCDLARLPLAAVRPEQVSSHLRGSAMRGLAVYGIGSIALMALCLVIFLPLSRLGMRSRRESGEDLSFLAGAAIFASVMGYAVAAFGERTGGPEWPGAAWFFDLLFVGMGAMAAAWLAARLVRDASRGRTRAGKIAALAAAPLLPALVLGAPVLLAAISATPGPTAPREADSLPDVILIAADSLRADALSCFGGDSPTPALDALAARGVKLTRASTPSPAGPPAVASLLTSLPPSENGITWQEGRLEDGVPTLAAVLRSHGYATAAFVGNPGIGWRQGLDEGFDLWDDAVDPRPEARYPEMLASRVRAALGWRRREAWPAAREMVGRVLAHLAAASDRPRFTYLHLSDPHDPYAPPPDLLAAVNAAAPGPLRFGPKTLGAILRGEIPFKDRDLKRTRALYQAEVAAMDREVGNLVSALKPGIESGDTILVFVSDHGEEMKDHGSMGHGHSLYEELIHVPAIFVSAKTLPPGKSFEAPASLLDVAPTILEILGIPPEKGFAGRSLAGDLAGGESSGEPRGPIVSQMDNIGYHTPWHWARAARSRDIKVILSSTDVLGLGAWKREAYDLDSDPGETSSIPPGQAEVDRLETWLRDWIARHAGAGSPPPPPPPGTDASQEMDRDAG